MLLFKTPGFGSFFGAFSLSKRGRRSHGGDGLLPQRRVGGPRGGEAEHQIYEELQEEEWSDCWLKWRVTARIAKNSWKASPEELLKTKARQLMIIAS